MPSTLAVERGLVLGNSGQAAVEPEGAPNLTYPIGDNRNPAELEFWHIQELLAKENSLEMIAKRAWTQEGNPLDLLQVGIIRAFAWEYSPLVLAGEALQLGYLKLKTLERGLTLEEAAELPIADTSPDLYTGLSWLLSAAAVASALPVPANLMAKTSAAAGNQKTAEQPENSSAGGQGPEFEIPGWVWATAGGIGFGWLISACARALGLPEPAVKVATNTPDAGPSPSPSPTEKSSPTHTAILAATSTETQSGGAGGAVFTADIGRQLEQLADANLPLPVCDQSGNQSADREQWESPQAADIEAKGGEVQNLYDLLRSKIPAGAQIRLCVNSEGWYFRVTTGDGIPVWNQVKGADGQWRWADHPNRIPVDENGNIGQWQMMRLPGPASDFRPLVIDGVPAEVQLDRDGRPTAYFDPLTGEWISLKPEPTPTRTASATPTIVNTPRPSAIAATAVPRSSPTLTLEPSPTATPQPEGFVSTRYVLPTREELIGCATGVKLSLREVDGIAPTTGIPYHHYRNRVISNNGGVLTFEGGRVENINAFAVTLILQVMIDDPENQNLMIDFWNDYSVNDFAQIIKPGDYVALNWHNGTPDKVILYCNSR